MMSEAETTEDPEPENINEQGISTDEFLVHSKTTSEVTEPEITAAPEIVPELESAWAEPEPVWSTSFSEWGVAWELHVYVFASCYLIVCILALLSLTYFFRNRQSLKRGRLPISLLLMIITFTMLRSLAMFVDPYGTVGILPGDYFRTLWGLTLPGLTASFSILLLVLLETTQLTLGPPRFQKLSTILICTGLHFGIVLASEVAFSLCESCRGMILFCQILFILYGALLCFGYMFSTMAIYKNTAAGNREGKESKKVLRLSKAAATASAISFFICITYIYDASSEFGIFSSVEYVDAWHWWALQTIKRLEEIAACSIVLVVTFKNPCEGFGHVTFCFRSGTEAVIKEAHTNTLGDATRCNL